MIRLPLGDPYPRERRTSSDSAPWCPRAASAVFSGSMIYLCAYTVVHLDPHESRRTIQTLLGHSVHQQSPRRAHTHATQNAARAATSLFALVETPSLSSPAQVPCRFGDLLPEIDHVDVCITVILDKNASSLARTYHEASSRRNDGVGWFCRS
jgi:hypothetical protein